MSKKIRILLDRHFPYEVSPLKNSENEIKKISLKKGLPRPIARVYHVLDLYFKSFKADVILGNRRTVLLLGLAYHLYKPKRISLLGYEIIFNFKDNFKNKLVKFIWRIAVHKIDRMVVMTQNEPKFLSKVFNTTPKKFRTIPFYTEGGDFEGPKENGYVFAAGRMERDFETLIYALSGTDYPAIIVADQSQKEKLEKIKPKNVEIFYNIPREKYLQLLKGSKMVVVPLYEGAASRGQVVILEAMKYGKPVISTKVNGTVDYLQHTKDGWFVEPANPESLRDLLNTYFEDHEVLSKIGKRAFNSQQSMFSPETFYKNYHELINQEYRRKNNSAPSKTTKHPEKKQEVLQE